jgi:glycosyl transferase, family 25
MTASPLLDYFDHIVIINLPQRRDRRRDIEAELLRLGIDPAHPQVDFFPGIRPATVDDWPSIGARGCFMSHLAVLERAREHGADRLLVLEDDCQFGRFFVANPDEVVSLLKSQQWHMVHLGHAEPGSANVPPRLVVAPRVVQTAHCYAVDRLAIDRLAEYMRAVMRRPAGHPLGGPQYPDGAFSMFREQHPELIALIATPSLASQRRSRSDIHARWFDRVPGLRTAAELSRRMRDRVVAK